MVERIAGQASAHRGEEVRYSFVLRPSKPVLSVVEGYERAVAERPPAPYPVGAHGVRPRLHRVQRQSSAPARPALRADAAIR